MISCQKRDGNGLSKRSFLESSDESFLTKMLDAVLDNDFEGIEECKILLDSKSGLAERASDLLKARVNDFNLVCLLEKHFSVLSIRIPRSIVPCTKRVILI